MRLPTFRSVLPCLMLAAFAATSGAALAQGRQKPQILPLPGTEKFTEADKKPMPPVNIPVQPENVWDLDLSSGGRVRIQLRPDVAPQHVERIKELTRRGFYNGLTFHRVIDGFMAQGGDPKGDGTGGSDLPDLQAEFTGYPHLRGTLSMARGADEDSANSQFFIMLMPRVQLDGRYTAFGRVIEGMQYVDAIAKGDPPANPTRIVRASMEAGDAAPVSAAPAPAAAAPTTVEAPPALDAPPAPESPAETPSAPDGAAPAAEAVPASPAE